MARQAVDIDLPVAQERRLRMSYEEWLDWSDEDVHSEWVDGEVTVFVPPGEHHQDIAGFLYVLLSWFARRLDLGKVLIAPFEMRVIPGRSSREPDLVFVAREHADRLDGQRLDGPADLVVEIVSPDSVTRDRRDKLAEYESVGIPEYWLLDPRPRRRTAHFHQLDRDGRYRRVSAGDDGRYRSAVLPGFWLDPGWLWQEPLPDPFALMPVVAPALWRETVAAAGRAATGDGA